MPCVLQILGFLLIFGLTGPLWAKETRQLGAKNEAISYLKGMRTQNVRRLHEIDNSLRARIEESTPGSVEFEVNRLKVAKREHSLRQEFLDRLIFQVDTKFAGGDLRLFLERALTEMAKIDATSADANSGLWKFLKFASDAVRRLPEKKENILVFLEGYMNRSVADPIRPEDYLSTRNYSNGFESQTGNPLGRDEVGAVADSRIRALKAEDQEAPEENPPADAAPAN